TVPTAVVADQGKKGWTKGGVPLSLERALLWRQTDLKKNSPAVTMTLLIPRGGSWHPPRLLPQPESPEERIFAGRIGDAPIQKPALSTLLVAAGWWKVLSLHSRVWAPWWHCWWA